MHLGDQRIRRYKPWKNRLLERAGRGDNRLCVVGCRPKFQRGSPFGQASVQQTSPQHHIARAHSIALHSRQSNRRLAPLEQRRLGQCPRTPDLGTGRAKAGPFATSESHRPVRQRSAIRCRSNTTWGMPDLARCSLIAIPACPPPITATSNALTHHPPSLLIAPYFEISSPRYPLMRCASIELRTNFPAPAASLCLPHTRDSRNIFWPNAAAAPRIPRNVMKRV